ncbi:surface antigen [Plasmodium falciparum UGT5.1]|uniref:Surface antigen n=1 Tax=Plasmodium falciparum UGT5.1 TaxID=1237627 RepID=W7JIX6_PLAFA|nr:surface antigen [Plasmodium falciparum UGT5.1]
MYCVHSKNKPYITPHTSTTSSRVLSECDLYISNYDKDADMKSVKEKFDRQTSQRFEEYDERMKGKRQKRKEERDKNIQEIIEKDKMDKSLAEKVEKGCLRCGCGLGGVAAGIGIIGGIAISELKKGAMAAAAQKGIKAGIATAIDVLKTKLGLNSLTSSQWTNLITEETFKNADVLSSSLKQLSDTICVGSSSIFDSDAFCLFKQYGESKLILAIKTHTGTAVKEAVEKYASVKNAEIDLVNAASSTYYTAIIASVVAILVIVLIMLIIYLILRYRRKKKMKKKHQYITLLKE